LLDIGPSGAAQLPAYPPRAMRRRLRRPARARDRSVRMPPRIRKGSESDAGGPRPCSRRPPHHDGSRGCADVRQC
jgi:hypothetical protein